MTETYRKKLIEVALPLEAINAAAAKEKSIRHGHPSTLHLWWARRPLAACRAVLFGQFVDDPSSVPEEFPSEEVQEAERQRLFRIIEDMVPWANSNDETIFHKARVEIARSIWRDLSEATRATLDQVFAKAFGGEPARSAEQLTRDQVIQFLQTHAPPVLDPFAGGGSIPLEAQRLGLRAIASDLNPVAVLINKALIEIPPKFAGQAPVNPVARKQKNLGAGGWKGAQGLANDASYYGEWMRAEAWKRIGHLYPEVNLPGEIGGKGMAMAWLWARTVKCPNPACGAIIPLVRSFNLSRKEGKETWVHPIADGKIVRFEVRTGQSPPTVGTVGRGGATCVVCAETTDLKHIRAEGKAGRLGVQPLAVVVEGKGGRVYISPSPDELPALSNQVAQRIEAVHRSDLSGETPAKLTGGTCYGYGLTTWGDLFTPRQLVALTTLSDLVGEAIERIRADAVQAGMNEDTRVAGAGRNSALAYAESVGVYLAIAVSRYTNYSSTLCVWSSHPKDELAKQVFMRQALPMTWDFAETNPFATSGGTFLSQFDWISRVLSNLLDAGEAIAKQESATNPAQVGAVVSTDPPYYDNIGYADLSDFFYVWLRRSLRPLSLPYFGTVLTPKKEEIVATSWRFGGDKTVARDNFVTLIESAFANWRTTAPPGIPIAVYYAFKQAEVSDDDGAIASTGWETMLEGLIQSGYRIMGTWPMRTELTANLKKNISALASSIVIICRQRPENAGRIDRGEFLRELRGELSRDLRLLQAASMAPVDLAQAAIGPGMAIFSKYATVLESDGSNMTVRTALQLINAELDTVLSADDGDADSDTRFAVAWYEQHRFNNGLYGDAETLSRAKNTAVQGVIEAGILRATGGKARLIPVPELPEDWDPTTDDRPTVWEATHHLIRQLDANGEAGAARLLAKLGPTADAARSLAYRLYSICERKGWTEEARAYNALILSWPDIARLARGEGKRAAGIEAWGDDEDAGDDN